VSVIGDVAHLSLDAAAEIGRMLGRTHGAVILHSQSDETVVEHFRRGIARNAYPPLFVQVPTERRALNRAFAASQPGDVILICPSDDGRAANRAVLRRQAD
jgi:hypothetical protein